MCFYQKMWQIFQILLINQMFSVLYWDLATKNSLQNSQVHIKRVWLQQYFDSVANYLEHKC